MNRQCPVPKYQRPLTEYNDLKNSFTFSWTKEKSHLFGKTLTIFLIILVFFIYILSIDKHAQEKNEVTSFLQMIASALGIFNLWILRLYLAWKYIYDRLMNATVSYEESGWYDGQTWVKTNEVLIQDRLVGTYEVLPVMDRLRTVILTLTTVIFFITYINIQH
uniref:Ycf36 protein n=1 Tax=Cryptomonas curvata TaxID=233186 RepID=A0A679CAR9_9CRYP|nr:ycf36 protein [Cryptomonas curvata]